MDNNNMSDYTKAEIGRLNEKIRRYQEAATKLDGLDPETKATVLESLKESIRGFDLNIKMIEHNVSQMSDVLKR